MLADEVLFVGDEYLKKSLKIEEIILLERTALIVSRAADTLKKFCNKILLKIIVNGFNMEIQRTR